MKQYLSLSLIFCTAIFLAACGGGTSNNAPTPNKANAASSTSPTSTGPLAVTTPTPSQVQNAAPTVTAVYQAFCAAVQKKDEAAVRKIYSADTIRELEKQMMDKGEKSLLKFLEDDIPSGQCSVKNEVIKGDTAVAYIVSDLYPNGIDIIFVKENGEWKMTTKSPAVDALKSTTGGK
ncbi:MAG TPA: hypothetical protein PKA82_10890 [Pyrinomonadaceae bacterium]|nr:hypothetical protein [Pyrinomonadaceae bacterium]